MFLSLSIISRADNFSGRQSGFLDEACQGDAALRQALPVFDAIAIAMTFFYFRNQKQLGEERKAIPGARG